MKATVTLKDNRDFQRLYRRGRSAVSPTMAIYWRSNRLGHNRLGITTGTKLGHAVVRNKMRRRVREIMRRHSGQLRQGMDLVIVVRQRAVQSDYWRMDRDFLRTADKLGILQAQEAE